MTTQAKALNLSAADNSLMSPNKRIIANNTLNVLFGPTASADVEMAACYPVAFNTNTGKYAPWIAPDPSKIVVDIGTNSGGTWGLTINGVVIANTVFAYNATAALVQATIRAYGYNVSVTLASGVYTITFDDDAEISVLPTVTGDVTQLSGGSGATATPDAGTATYNTHKIVGFVYPETITTDQTDDVIGVITQECEIAYAEIAALIGSGSLTALQAALKDGLVAKGIIVQGLVGIH